MSKFSSCVQIFYDCKNKYLFVISAGNLEVKNGELIPTLSGTHPNPSLKNLPAGRQGEGLLKVPLFLREGFRVS
jgi:hypothetical protein